MDNRKILIINLSKGRVGEANANLLGSMLITKIYLAAMSRADLREDELKKVPQFYLYVDEFQSFANESFADILSEARKYKLNLTIAHQYIEQMTDEVRAAVFGNVGTMITFRVGAHDGSVFEKEFAPEFTAEDLVNLQQYQMYLKLMIDGVTSRPFSAIGMAPIAKPEVSYYEDILKLSREQFAAPREKIESEIREWHEKKIKPAVNAGGSSSGKSSAGSVKDKEGGRERSLGRDSGSRGADRGNRDGGVRGGNRDNRGDGGRNGNSHHNRNVENVIDVKTSEHVTSHTKNEAHPKTDIKSLISEAQTQNETNEPKESDNIIKPVSLNNLANGHSQLNKSKNNQKVAKPENVEALRNALLSVMGDKNKEKVEECIEKKPDGASIEECVTKIKEENKVVNKEPVKNKDHMTQSTVSQPTTERETKEKPDNSGTLSTDELKKILDID